MRTIKVTIERADANSFSAYTDAEFDGFGLAGYGSTAEEAKKDFLEAYNEARDMFNCPELAFEWQDDLKKTMNQETPKQKLKDILLDINISKIANRYFNRSSSWLYHKLDRIDGNCGVDDFSAEELKTLKNGLIDLADRIKCAADKL